MKKNNQITRRNAIVTGLTSLTGLFIPASISGLLLSGCSKTLPPTYGNILRMGDVLTYAAQRNLLSGQSLAKEYNFGDISSFPATGTTNPGDPDRAYYNKEFGPIYAALEKEAFTDWRLSIEGHVARPGSYSLTDLQKFPSKTQITRHTCEEGWSAIAEWTGIALSHVLKNAGILPSARFVNFYTYDDYADSIDMLDALHPQTILTYGMNGKALPIPHGAPLRIRVEKQMGYKSVKYIQRIVVTNEFDDLGKLGSIQNGWSWYAGI